MKTKAQLEASNGVLTIIIVMLFFTTLAGFIAFISEQERNIQITKEKCVELLIP